MLVLDPGHPALGNQQPACSRACDKLEVLPAERGSQERIGGAPSPPAPGRRLEQAHPVLPGAVVIGVVGDPGRLRRIDEGRPVGREPAALGDMQFAVAAVELIGDLGVALVPAEEGQHRLICPAGRPMIALPAVVVERVAARVDIALIDELPPSTRPLGSSRRRPNRPGSGPEARFESNAV